MCSQLLQLCNGCKHQWYAAPAGQAWNKNPHVRCLFFKADIPMVVEKKIGCDGTRSEDWIGCEIPPACPTRLAAAQERLF